MSVSRLHIDLSRQQLDVLSDGHVLRSFKVSTAANGAGQQRDSECTPLGAHVVRARIGAGAPPGTVFVARRPTGERFTPALREQQPDRDWILTRILWLSGLETGHNRLGDVDTMQRYIYIHGAPDDAAFGKPASHGCIRMRNSDIIELFDEVAVGTRVDIVEGEAG